MLSRRCVDYERNATGSDPLHADLRIWVTDFEREMFTPAYFLIFSVSCTCLCVFVSLYHCQYYLPSVLWRCWLGGRKGIRPVKTEWWGAGMVICLERGADLHMAQLMPLPLTVSWFSKIQIDFTFLVPAHLGSPGMAVKRMYVCMYHCQYYSELCEFGST